MRQVALTTIKGGITRQRVKGAALNDSLYDLLNGYVTSARTVRQRPGTRRIYDLPEGTKGLVSFRGVLHVFSHEPVPGIPDGVELTILQSPDGNFPIREIHFAEPFLGALYVVAEFENDATWHFWLEQAVPWEPNTVYRHGAIVAPTSGDAGLVFRARRGSDPYPLWQPNVERTTGDRIEPTIYNDFFYEAVATTGDTPRSGAVEPEWPTTDGGQVTETPDGAIAGPGGDTPPAGSEPPPDGTTTPSGGGSSPGGTRYDLRLF